MKKTLSIIIILLSVLSLSAQLTKDGYYYLEHPINNIFSMSFRPLEKGKGDPNRAFSASSTKITDKDLEVNKSSTSQTVDVSQNSNHSFLAGTWNHGRGLKFSGTFYNVKHVSLKDSAWSKIGDKLLHVVEGLRADSVVYTIVKSKTDSLGSKAFQTILTSLLKSNVAIAVVLKALGNKDSSQTNLVRLRFRSRDSLSFVLKDSTVYFAVRYAQVGKITDNTVFFRPNKLKGPECAIDFKPNDDTISKVLNRKKQQISFLKCVMSNQKLDMNFIYDTAKETGMVFILGTLQNTLSGGSTDKTDTIWKSSPIDFSNTLSVNYLEDFHRFVSTNAIAAIGTKNDLAVCAYCLNYDPDTRKFIVVNWNGSYYSTCVYHQNADIRFFPK